MPERCVVIDIVSFLLSLPMVGSEASIGNEGWDLSPVVTFIAVILIIRFAVVCGRMGDEARRLIDLS